MGKRRQRPVHPADPRLWPTRLGLALFWLIGQLPWDLLLAAGRGLGRLAWYLARDRRRVTLINLKLCFPELSEGLFVGRKVGPRWPRGGAKTIFF